MTLGTVCFRRSCPGGLSQRIPQRVFCVAGISAIGAGIFFLEQLGKAWLGADGIGTPRNCFEAARWFRASAELGNSLAQYDLGSLYFRGVGVPLDYTEAARWALLAAQQGNINAQTALASLYETGKGVPLDYVAAYAWYSRAIAGGDRTASERRKSLSNLMTSKQREKADTLLSVPMAH